MPPRPLSQHGHTPPTSRSAVRATSLPGSGQDCSASTRPPGRPAPTAPPARPPTALPDPADGGTTRCRHTADSAFADRHPVDGAVVARLEAASIKNHDRRLVSGMHYGSAAVALPAGVDPIVGAALPNHRSAGVVDDAPQPGISGLAPRSRRRRHRRSSVAPINDQTAAHGRLGDPSTSSSTHARPSRSHSVSCSPTTRPG